MIPELSLDHLLFDTLENDTDFSIRPIHHLYKRQIIQEKTAEGNIKFAMVDSRDEMISIVDAYGRCKKPKEAEKMVKFTFKSNDMELITAEGELIKLKVKYTLLGPEIEIHPSYGWSKSLPFHHFPLSLKRNDATSRYSNCECLNGKFLFSVYGGKFGKLTVAKGTPMKVVPSILAIWRIYLKASTLFCGVLLLVDIAIIATFITATVLTGNVAYIPFVLLSHAIYTALAIFMLM